jgi:outer membrane protein OmpA-like peptidoglycan-associated protein
MAMRGSMVAAVALAALTGGCTTMRIDHALVRPQARCADVSFPIYFASGSTALTPPALQMIQATAAQTRGCQATAVNVTGLADADGGAQRNAALAQDRAKVVAQALAAQGFPAPAFDIESAGASGARTASGQAAPQRRRAEVAIAFKH